MFRALKKSGLPPDQVFSCHIGPGSKQTEAGYHLRGPANGLEMIATLNSS